MLYLRMFSPKIAQKRKNRETGSRMLQKQNRAKNQMGSLNSSSLKVLGNLLDSNSGLNFSSRTLGRRSVQAYVLLQNRDGVPYENSDPKSKEMNKEAFGIFWNQSFDKGRLKAFVFWFFQTYGEYRTVAFVESLKNLGFHYATLAGITLGLEDLKIPSQKSSLIAEADCRSLKFTNKAKKGEVTEIEKFGGLIETWHQTSEDLKKAIIQKFETTERFNPVYMMAFSGARGNLSQVRQLVGMRGLMADPQGQIIDFPIRSNFREGLTLTEYVISTYGARKGIVDTALRTANAGYLTRRLVDVAQHVIISKFDCGTLKGVWLSAMQEGRKTLYPLEARILGRVLSQDILFKNEIIAFRNEEVSSELARKIAKVTKKVAIRSPLTCQSPNLLCQLCYGWSLGEGRLVSIGETVGVIAAQSIGEPGTQLTMRTFHTGGVFSGDSMEQIRAPFSGLILYSGMIPGILIRTLEGEIAFLTKSDGGITLIPKSEKKRSVFHSIPASTVLYRRNGEKFREGEVLAQIFSLSNSQKDEEQQKILSEYEGEIYHGHMDVWEKEGASTQNRYESWGWGYLWILSGKILRKPIPSNFFLDFGDFVHESSPFAEIDFFTKSKLELHFWRNRESVKNALRKDGGLNSGLNRPKNFLKLESSQKNSAKESFSSFGLSQPSKRQKSENKPFSLFRNSNLYKRKSFDFLKDEAMKKSEREEKLAPSDFSNGLQNRPRPTRDLESKIEGLEFRLPFLCLESLQMQYQEMGYFFSVESTFLKQNSKKETLRMVKGKRMVFDADQRSKSLKTFQNKEFVLNQDLLFVSSGLRNREKAGASDYWNVSANLKLPKVTSAKSWSMTRLTPNLFEDTGKIRKTRKKSKSFSKVKKESFYLSYAKPKKSQSFSRNRTNEGSSEFPFRKSLSKRKRKLLGVRKSQIQNKGLFDSKTRERKTLSFGQESRFRAEQSPLFTLFPKDFRSFKGICLGVELDQAFLPKLKKVKKPVSSKAKLAKEKSFSRMTFPKVSPIARAQKIFCINSVLKPEVWESKVGDMDLWSLCVLDQLKAKGAFSRFKSYIFKKSMTSLLKHSQNPSEVSALVSEQKNQIFGLKTKDSGFCYLVSKGLEIPFVKNYRAAFAARKTSNKERDFKTSFFVLTDLQLSIQRKLLKEKSLSPTYKNVFSSATSLKDQSSAKKSRISNVSLKSSSNFLDAKQKGKKSTRIRFEIGLFILFSKVKSGTESSDFQSFLIRKNGIRAPFNSHPMTEFLSTSLKFKNIVNPFLTKNSFHYFSGQHKSKHSSVKLKWSLGPFTNGWPLMLSKRLVWDSVDPSVWNGRTREKNGLPSRKRPLISPNRCEIFDRANTRSKSFLWQNGNRLSLAHFSVESSLSLKQHPNFCNWITRKPFSKGFSLRKEAEKLEVQKHQTYKTKEKDKQNSRFILFQKIDEKVVPKVNLYKKKLYQKSQKAVQQRGSLPSLFFFGNHRLRFFNLQKPSSELLERKPNSDLQLKLYSSAQLFRKNPFYWKRKKQTLDLYLAKYPKKRPSYLSFGGIQSKKQNSLPIFSSLKLPLFSPLRLKDIWIQSRHLFQIKVSISVMSNRSFFSLDPFEQKTLEVRFLPTLLSSQRPKGRILNVTDQNPLSSFIYGQWLIQSPTFPVLKALSSSGFLAFDFITRKEKPNPKPFTFDEPSALSANRFYYPQTQTRYFSFGSHRSDPLKKIASTAFLSPYRGEILSSLENPTVERQMLLSSSDLQSFSILSAPNVSSFESEKSKGRKESFKEAFLSFQRANGASKFESESFSFRIQSKTRGKNRSSSFRIQGLSLGKAKNRSQLRLGAFLFYGDFLSRSESLCQSGQLVHANLSKITLRKGQPLFVSPKSSLHYDHGELIQKNQPAVTLCYQRILTGDIVQGIPKIEQIFEGRTTKKGRVFLQSLPLILSKLFQLARQKLPVDKAVEQSFYLIQQILVHSVQSVYRSQGVSIADKHIEIIARQMTSRVQVVHPGQTAFVPGESMDRELVEKINRVLLRKMIVRPILSGISQAALQGQGFLSSASFQYTKKVLSQAALYQKRDFLKGLKENLLVGNLIPGGTGILSAFSPTELSKPLSGKRGIRTLGRETLLGRSRSVP